jgi:hypothetical protein
MKSGGFGKLPLAQCWREFAMQDAIFLAVTILFFVISLAYIHFCEKVR